MPDSNAGSDAARLILNKIEELTSDVHDLRELMSKSLSHQAVAEAKLAAVLVDVGRLNTIVRDGNGSPSLLTQVSQLQANRLTDREISQGNRVADREALHANTSAITDLVRRFDAFDAVGSSAFQDWRKTHLRDAQDATTARRGMWIGIVTGLLGIVAAIVTAVAPLLATAPAAPPAPPPTTVSRT